MLKGGPFPAAVHECSAAMTLLLGALLLFSPGSEALCSSDRQGRVSLGSPRVTSPLTARGSRAESWLRLKTSLCVRPFYLKSPRSVKVIKTDVKEGFRFVDVVKEDAGTPEGSSSERKASLCRPPASLSEMLCLCCASLGSRCVCLFVSPSAV